MSHPVPGERGDSANAVFARVLSRIRRRLWARALTGGLLSVFWTAATALVALFAADRFLFMAPAARVAAVSLVAGGTAALLYARAVVILFRRPDARDAARALEGKFPSLGDFAMSAAELTSPLSVRSSGPSRELVSLTVEEALRRVRATPGGRLGRKIAAPLAAAAAAASVWALAAAMFPSDTAVFFKRMVEPFGPAVYPTKTRIAEIEAPSVVPLGEAFTAAVAVEGVKPSEAVFRVKVLEGSSRRIYAAGSRGRYMLTLEEARTDFVWSVAVGDALSSEREVKVVPRPAVTALEALVEYPRYTRVAPARVGGGGIKALAGSKALIKASFNKPVKEARLLFEGGATAEGLLGQEGSSAEFAVDIDREKSYTIDMRDEYGFGPADSGSYSITPLNDAAPGVALERPGRDLTAVADAVVPVEATAEDEFGLTSLALYYTVERADGGVTAERVVLDEGGAMGNRSAQSLAWRLDALELSPGDEVRYRIEATDSRPGAPNTAASDTFWIRIVTVEEKLAELEQMERRLQSSLHAMARIQQSARDGLEPSAGREEQP